MCIRDRRASARPQVEIDPTQGTRHSVYIAFCDGATIIIKGKCKGVAVDACAKSEVRMESAISSLEIVNSKRMVCRVSGMVPSIAIDKTDGMNTYLSAEAATVTSFLTSKARAARAARCGAPTR